MMNLCLNCRRRSLTCVCSLIHPFETESRFIILMHPMEYKKEKVGTGRFSHLILKNSEVLVDVSFDQNRRFLELINDPDYETYLLYPGDEVVNLSEIQTWPVSTHLKKQFIVIDGTWPCAKKMMKVTTLLHHLPRVSFSSTKQSEFKIKHQPLPGCLSTVESIHQVICELNRLGVEKTGQQEENLIKVFRHTVDQQIQLASDPDKQGYRRKAFSSPEKRRISTKWDKRLLFFKK